MLGCKFCDLQGWSIFLIVSNDAKGNWLWWQVIFMFGEIDCREGLTMAVDKLKYETVDAAMDVLLHIYKGRPLLQATTCPLVG